MHGENINAVITTSCDNKITLEFLKRRSFNGETQLSNEIITNVRKMNLRMVS
jgi:hypothetical protein